tara:strand:- start:535 stop:744 length:210 start_codon:yes stop_codon:yes gene_type:complete
MGYSTQTIPFFSDTIKIKPHTATHGKHLDRAISIKQFTKGAACSLEQRTDNKEYFVRLMDGTFIEGPEA